jgi:hypothetical protein
MTAGNSVQVTADNVRGHVMLSLGVSGASCHFTREEALNLASRLGEAAKSLEPSGERVRSEDDDDFVTDLLEELKHEEKEAHGGD